MKSRELFFVALILSMGTAGCVTTRSELNRQREEGKTELPPPEAPAEVSKTDLAKAEPAAPAPSPAELKPPYAPPASPSASPEPSPAASPASAVSDVKPPYAIPVTAPVAAASPTASATPAPRTDLTTLSEDELRAELAKTSGRVEELQHEQELKEKTHADEIRKSQDRIAELEKRLRELAPEAPRVPEGKSPMDAAKDAYSAGNWDDAIAFFTEVLSKTETGKIAEEATYLRGESYFKKLQYNRAILDYSKFPERFQKSSFHPKALLRIGESFDAMGRREDAKTFFAELLEKFPKTAEGRIAKKKLKK